MQLIKLTVLSSLLFAFVVSLISCEKEVEKKKANEFVKSGIVMSAAQENNPNNTSPALGSLDVFYAKSNKVLSYKFTWQGLTDTIIGVHIHGLAPTGFNTGIVQNILVLNTRNEALFPWKGGSYTGTFNVDGVVVKEENLLNGMYYVNIHTKTYPGGEIRGQIRFQ
jgi:hypothetical protein